MEAGQKKTGPGIGPEPVILVRCWLRARVPAPAAAAAEAAEPGMRPSLGLPSRPDTSASPEVAAGAAGAEEAAAAVV